MDPTNIYQDILSITSRESASATTGKTKPQLGSSIGHGSPQVVRPRSKVEAWNGISSLHSLDSDGGFIADLNSLIGTYFTELDAAVDPGHRAISTRDRRAIDDVRESSIKFRIWRNSVNDLDRKLAMEPSLRREVVRFLIALAADFFQGMTQHWRGARLC